jgi:hypothetical protein
VDEGAGIQVPEEIGFAALTHNKETSDMAGIDQRQEMVGAAAMDLVIGHIYRNEYGMPGAMKTVFIDGVWKNGNTVLNSSV